jgi:hypothetical protein
MEKYKYLDIKELIQIKEEVVERMGLSFKFKDYLIFHVNNVLFNYMFELDTENNRESFSMAVEKNIYNLYTKLSKDDIKLSFDKDDKLKLIITCKNDYFRDLLEEEINILDLVKVDRKRKLDSLYVRTIENKKIVKR